jgi:CxxC motif-containing protein (DUF1111 family)
MLRQFGLFLLFSLWTQALLAQVNPFSISEEGLDYIAGQAIFEKTWVSPPSSTQASDGLGPLYNARSCAQCHVNAGKGNPEDSLVLRIEHPEFGRQLQPRAVPGLAAESQIEVSYQNSQVAFADGSTVNLRQPLYALTDLQESIPYSPRIAPSLAGIGQLANIPYFDIIGRADPADRNNDGISGRPGAGRFGWKGETDSLAEQVALALSLDIGISSTLFPDPYADCTPLQQDCLRMPHGASQEHDDMELSIEAFYSLVNFVRQIPAPASASADLPGETVFNELGCAACHNGVFGAGTQNAYSDLLLHDMGAGLADAMQNALSQEWRTAPLWGLSAQAQQSEQYYLHDGRARSLIEAIVWHGGEAEQAKQAFLALPAGERESLITFLQSL